MKKVLLITLLVVGCTQPKKEIQPAAETKPLSEDYVLVASIENTKQKDEYPFELCMYTHTETRGVLAATACVAVLIEGQSRTRHPFYGSKGHWGIEGNCDAKRIADKFKEPQTMTTVNPISDLKAKRKLGMKLTILKDDFKLGDALLAVTKP